MQKPVEKPIKFKKNLETKGKSYPITHVEAVIDSEGKNISQMLTSLKKGQTLTETSSSDLKNQRDNGELITGAYYRITDVDGNAFPPDSPYYGKQLDVILVATSPNTLSEEGYAIVHNPDVYDVTFIDGTILKCYVHQYTDDSGVESVTIINCETKLGNVYHTGIVTIDEANKTAVLSRPVDDLTIPMEELVYDDFQGENLKAWKIWYCIDNDKERFPWADDTYKLNPSSIICDCYVMGTKVDGPINNYGKQFVNGAIYYRDEEKDTVIPFMGNVPAYAWTSENNITIFTTNVAPSSPKSTTYTYSTGGGLTTVGGDQNMYYLTTSYVEGLPNYDFPNGHGVIYKVEKEGENSNITKVTWQELKNLRDNSHLTPGYLYRITDYNCTTTQENTRSAGHQFDIVLLALSEDKLAEEGWAMMNESNIYDVTFNDGVTKKCYVYPAAIQSGAYNFVDIETLLGEEDYLDNINDIEKTAEYDGGSSCLRIEGLQYNYFQNSNLSAWKVWYCLDNDTDKFAWAEKDVPTFTCNINVPSAGWSFENVRVIRDYGADYDGRYAYVVINGDTVTNIATDRELKDSGDYTIYLSVYVSANAHVEILSSSITANGRGIIYRLIDEFNNDIKYDFKNIQFKRTLVDGQYDEQGDETWCYTLNIYYQNRCQDASIIGNTLPNDEGFVIGVYDNKFGYATAYDLYIQGVNTFAFALGNNVVLAFDNDGCNGIHSNTIRDTFYNNTIGNSFNSNTIGNIFSSNTIGDFFEFNTIGNDFSANTIGNSFSANTIGNYFSANTIRDNFNANMIGNSFSSKTINDDTNNKNYGNNGVELATKS